ncbi:DUF3047 domain-containing protein [Ideonella sp.]|uniref:DUF3047 domain-containing protein n=1 Tax=Ideonella sp. TaxID=1929293 RepID=UPI003BB49CB5
MTAAPHLNHLLPDRRRWLLGAASLAGLAALPGCAVVPDAAPGPDEPAAATPAPAQGPALFSAATALGGLPAGWHPHIMRRTVPATRYALVDKDQRRVIHAQAERSSSGLRCDVNLDPADQPWLDWTWRVDAIDTRATVADDDLDDSPARLALAFDGDLSTLPLRELMFREQVELFTGHVLPFASLMYVWDGHAPVGSVFFYPRSRQIRYLVVESGPARTGQWLGYQRNVLQDYLQVFGHPPGRLRSVGVMSDSDDLKNSSQAWFGDLRFGSARPTGA